MSSRPKRKIRRQLCVQANDNCPNCGGSGLRVNNVYNAAYRRLEVTVDVCPCVRVVPIPKIGDADVGA